MPVDTRLVTGSIVFGLGIMTVNNLAEVVLADRFTFRLKLIIVSPVRRLSYALGVIIFSALQGMVTTGLILLSAPLFGIDIELSLWLLPLALITAASMSGIGLVVGTWAPAQQTGSALAGVMGIVVVMISPVYYDIGRLPEWLQWPARLSPYTHAGNAINGVLSGAGGFYAEMGILALITAAALALGVARMRWREV